MINVFNYSISIIIYSLKVYYLEMNLDSFFRKWREKKKKKFVIFNNYVSKRNYNTKKKIIWL